VGENKHALAQEALMSHPPTQPEVSSGSQLSESKNLRIGVRDTAAICRYRRPSCYLLPAYLGGDRQMVRSLQWDSEALKSLLDWIVLKENDPGARTKPGM
jgi:hypothetical protein